MSGENSEDTHNNERASDEELFSILREAKEQDGIPALTTSQFNHVGGYDYSTQGLNDRLMNLHEDGIIGHQKASNRHFWWLSSEGSTDTTELSSLEEMVDYEELDPERFSEEKAVEIAKTSIPGYQLNWWQRVYRDGDDYFRVGAIMFLSALGSSAADLAFLPQSVLAGVLLVGFLVVLISMGYYSIGMAGQFLSQRTSLPEEPWGGDGLGEMIFERGLEKIRS
jgi:hypothetical protein